MATLSVSAEQAAQQVSSMMRKQRTQRILPKLSPSQQKMSDENTVYMFNVGPWSLTREMGSWGNWHIPACPKDQACAPIKPIPGIFTEPIPIDERNFKLDQYEGSYVAEQILGVGKHIPKSLSFVKYGVFIAAGKKPTKEELEQARQNLNDYYMELVREARSAHNQGPKESEQVITDKHRLAAQEMGLTDEAWLGQYSPESRQKCPIDGTYTEKGVLMCPTCQFIFGDDVKEHLDRVRKARKN